MAEWAPPQPACSLGGLPTFGCSSASPPCPRSICMWELLTWQVPYWDVGPWQVVAMVTENAKRPEVGGCQRAGLTVSALQPLQGKHMLLHALCQPNCRLRICLPVSVSHGLRHSLLHTHAPAPACRCRRARSCPPAPSAARASTWR